MTSHNVRSMRSGAMLALAAAALLLGGCSAAPTRPEDPLEPMNRVLYRVHDGVDKVILTPVNTVYTTIVPRFVRTGVSNFYNNFEDLFSAVNDLLQAKPQKAGDDLGRVLTNTMFGFGLFDVASDAGIERGNEDFGQTLAVWGIGNGPYLFIPVWGPTTVRDGFGSVVTAYAHPISWLEDVPLRNSLYGLRVVDLRYQAGDALSVVETAALDRYSFIRNAYFQRRRYLIYDGKVPPDAEDKP